MKSLSNKVIGAVLVGLACSVSYAQPVITEQGFVSDAYQNKAPQQPAPIQSVSKNQMPNQDIWAPVHVPNHWNTNDGTVDNLTRADKLGGLIKSN